MESGARVVQLDRIALNQVSTGEHVAAVLRDKIVRGEIEPGTRLPEHTLAESFGVSRNTIREALRELDRQGIVRHHMHRGATVAEITAADVVDIFRVRRVLELAAADAAAPTPETLAPLEEALERLRAAVADADMATITEADLEFHRSLVALLGSPRLDALFETLRLELLLCLSIVDSQSPDDMPRLVAEHEELLSLLVAGKRRELRRVLAGHLDGAEALLRGLPG